MPTITQLEYLLAVSEEKHFGRAAEKCHVSQPSLSIQIQKLEEELGLIILDRSKKPIIVTEEGQVIIDQARKTLREHKKLFTLAQGSSLETRGDFHLAVIPTLSPYLIPLFLGEFSKEFPKVNLKINEYQTDDIIKMLKDDVIDAALLVTPLNDDTIIERHLFYEPFYAYLSEGHELLKKGELTHEDLLGQDLWLLEEGHCFRDQMLKICSLGRQNKVMENVEFASGNLETLKNLVKKSCGFTILPELAVLGLGKGEREKHLRNFKAPVPTREVSIVHSRSFLKERIIKHLEETIIKALPKDIRSLKRGDINLVNINK
ncbi:MAG: LysR family transcriptional regulator [Bacteriovoracaceae bacterium]|nr:LysR family transcriptional regulator [Bacteriovoracaceae bacterium]